MTRFIAALLITAFLVLPASAEEYIDTGEVSDMSIFEESEEAVAGLATDSIDLGAPSAILIEKKTGTVLYEKNADEILAPASVTKVMTMLLIVEEIDAGTLHLEDTIITSANAASMGGSQVFLEEGEQMTLHEMLKSIVVSSANDACVAVAEHISGTESAFVAKMNAKAAQLGATNTHFINCTGLPVDSQENQTTARDIAIMSQALISHDMIKEYTTIWMDTVRNGEFGLSNTNKLIRFYDGATGLKTGFTQTAGYCLSATAERDGVEYIAVVLHCETSDIRFESTKILLSYAFANYTVVDVQPDEILPPIAVELGTSDYVQPILGESAQLLLPKNIAASITKTVEIEARLDAPVTEGQQVGTLTVNSADGEIAKIPIVAGDSVAKLSWIQVYGKFMQIIFTGGL